MPLHPLNERSVLAVAGLFEEELADEESVDESGHSKREHDCVAEIQMLLLLGE
jgi:hypothetical protein